MEENGAEENGMTNDERVRNWARRVLQHEEWDVALSELAQRMTAASLNTSDQTSDPSGIVDESGPAVAFAILWTSVIETIIRSSTEDASFCAQVRRMGAVYLVRFLPTIQYHHFAQRHQTGVRLIPALRAFMYRVLAPFFNVTRGWTY